MNARRIAANIAKLPNLLGKVQPDDSSPDADNLSDERHEGRRDPLFVFDSG